MPLHRHTANDLQMFESALQEYHVNRFLDHHKAFKSVPVLQNVHKDTIPATRVTSSRLTQLKKRWKARAVVREIDPSLHSKNPKYWETLNHITKQ